MSTERLAAELRTILPAWFGNLMASTPAVYGMLLSNGTLLAVRRVAAVTRDSSGGIWLDVELIDATEKADVLDEGLRERSIFATATSSTASVSVANVAAVIEMGEPER